MDFLIKHWAGFPRRYPSTFPLASASTAPLKSEWIRLAFTTCNFSLIMRGRGTYHRLGRAWPVQAPCVITQWPGEHVEYGPAPGETWDELYLIYSAKHFRRFASQGIIDPAKPVWPIANAPAVHTQISELAALAQTRRPEEHADRVDRVCERLILETLLPAPDVEVESETVSMIGSIMHELRRDLAADIDLDRLADNYGLSPATFRRRWAEVIPTPPARYRLQLRIQKACRLLAETTRPIHEVARTVGFNDELYFSRRFHQHMKLAPRAYRRMYQIQPTP